MQQLATACEAIAATTKKLLKTAIVADYLKSRPTDEAAVSAIFLSGRAFPAWEETTLQVGGRSLWGIVAELSGKNEGEINAAYRRHGDLGAVAGEVLAGHAGQGLGVLDVAVDVHVNAPMINPLGPDTSYGRWPHRVADLGPFQLLDVAATRDAQSRRLTISVVNRDPGQALDTRIRLDGARAAGPLVASVTSSPEGPGRARTALVFLSSSWKSNGALKFFSTPLPSAASPPRSA